MDLSGVVIDMTLTSSSPSCASDSSSSVEIVSPPPLSRVRGKYTALGSLSSGVLTHRGRQPSQKSSMGSFTSLAAKSTIKTSPRNVSQAVSPASLLRDLEDDAVVAERRRSREPVNVAPSTLSSSLRSSPSSSRLSSIFSKSPKKGNVPSREVPVVFLNTDNKSQMPPLQPAADLTSQRSSKFVAQQQRRPVKQQGSSSPTANPVVTTLVDSHVGPHTPRSPTPRRSRSCAPSAATIASSASEPFASSIPTEPTPRRSRSCAPSAATIASSASEPFASSIPTERNYFLPFSRSPQPRPRAPIRTTASDEVDAVSNISPLMKLSESPMKSRSRAHARTPDKLCAPAATSPQSKSRNLQKKMTPNRRFSKSSNFIRKSPTRASTRKLSTLSSTSHSAERASNNSLPNETTVGAPKLPKNRSVAKFEHTTNGNRSRIGTETVVSSRKVESNHDSAVNPKPLVLVFGSSDAAHTVTPASTRSQARKTRTTRDAKRSPSEEVVTTQPLRRSKRAAATRAMKSPKKRRKRSEQAQRSDKQPTAKKSCISDVSASMDSNCRRSARLRHRSGTPEDHASSDLAGVSNAPDVDPSSVAADGSIVRTQPQCSLENAEAGTSFCCIFFAFPRVAIYTYKVYFA